MGPSIPDFLCKLVALAKSTRLSLKKGAHATLYRGARQEIRVQGLPAGGVPANRKHRL
jgi:hypothetical protein